ncbi:MAG: LacI family DNA-binding transcriptional regulator [Spirochaetota bacterium]
MAEREYGQQDVRSPAGGRRATIKDVAERAGVSTGTVSRVLNRHSAVRPTTRQRVLSVMQELNYEPDLVARELSRGSGPIIGLSVGAGSRRLIPFFMLFLEHLAEATQEQGFRFEEIPTDANGLPRYTTDALVLFGAHEDDTRVPYLQEKQTPFVLVGHREGVRWIAPDDIDGGYQAGRHLARLGHRRILHLSGFMPGQAAADRLTGFRRALDEAGVVLRSDHILDGRFTALDAYRCTLRYYRNGGDATAVFAASDEMAVGAMAALEDLGLQVPGQVSVVGFDDLPEFGENITTIRQDIALLAGTSVELVKEAMAGKPVRHELIPVHLVARNTSARAADENR